MNAALRLYNRLSGLPFGRYVFSRLVCFRAPYFGTIRPRFTELRPGLGELTMKKRRAVTNHLKSVHAIAMANMCELVGGLTLDVTLPPSLRWIPKSMNIEYLKIARTGLRARCEIPENTIVKPGDYSVAVHVTDTQGTEVVRADILMHVSARKKEAA